MINTALNPALMLNFKSEIKDIPTIDLTGEEAIIHYPPLRGNIAQDPEDNLDASTAALAIPSIGMLFMMNPSKALHLCTRALPGLQLYHLLQVCKGIPTSSLIIDTKTFSPKSIDRVKALMSKENRANTLITVGVEETATCFDAPTPQDEESYDGDISWSR